MHRGWVGWIERNPLFSVFLALVLGATSASAFFLAADVGTPSVSVDSGTVAGGVTGPGGSGTAEDGSSGGVATDPVDGGAAGTATDDGASGNGSVGAGGDAGAGGTTGSTGSSGSTSGSSGSSTGGSTTGGTSGGGTSPGGTTGGSTGTGSGSGSGTGSGTGSGGGSGGGSGTGTSTGTGSAGCTPRSGYTTVGVTETEVVLGQILSDVSQLPQQFGPLRDGLNAAVKVINDAGGVCGRKLRVEYRNDNATPANAISAYRELKDQVFVFAGIGSLMDQVWYEDSPPFGPRRDIAGDSIVPDIGGQGFSINRAQSPIHFSPMGSLSPVLTGGTAFLGFQNELRAAGNPCSFGGIAFLQEPTGASEQQAQTGRLAIAGEQGMNIGVENTKMYGVPLAAPVAQWEATVRQMVGDGVDCMFVYGDLGSAGNAVLAARNQGVWPPDDCTLNCFDLIWSPYTIYDPQFVNAVGDAGERVRTFLPHLPFQENSAITTRYVRDLKAVAPNAVPTTFGALGYESGFWVRDALVACGAAPTRDCILDFFRTKQDYQATGLFGPITPFRTTRATYEGTTWDWRWVFNCTIRVQLQNKGGGLEWVRTGPTGFECGALQAVRGSA